MPHPATFLQRGENLDTMSPAASRHRSRGRMLLVGGLTLVILAGCTSATSSTSSSSTSGSSPSSSTPSSGSTSSSPSSSTSTSPAESLTGSWVGTWAIDPPYAGSVGTFTMELVQTDGAFSGTVEITNTDCSNGTVSGTVAGTSLTFDWLLTPEPVQLTGVFDGTAMSGTWAANACSDSTIFLTGTWEATKP